MTQILSGKEVVKALEDKLIKEVDKLRERSIIPTLAIVRVGQKGSDIAYQKSAIKKANYLGLDVKVYVLDEDVEQGELIKLLRLINMDDEVHGVLLFRPLPSHLDEDFIRNVVDSDKDVDGITDGSLVGIYAGMDIGYPPCTAEAAMEILKYYKIPIEGSRVVTIGRSLVVGKPVTMMLMGENATVTACHSRTSEIDLREICNNADVIVVATGKRNTINGNHVGDKQIVIDVGINFDEEGKMCGDANFKEIGETVKAITPVPGGVGSVTTTLLMKHVVEAAKKTIRHDQ